MRKSDFDFLRSLTLACLVDVPRQKPSDWAMENLTFDEAGNHGAFKLAGCEYIKDPLDDFGDPLISDEVLVWGSQTRKTGTLMGGVAWALRNDPSPVLWVMPSMQLAQKFSRQRWQKLLKASAGTRDLVPRGARRHEFATLSMMLGASTINFAGSNSPANLSSNPCRRVVLDEVDKFDQGGREEADAVNLAEQRTKAFANSQRWKTSTPTLVTGLIWQEFLKGTQSRFFVPCPRCQKLILFAWSAEYTMLAKTGAEAFVHWDKEAKRRDGSWDFERVRKSARFFCPHNSCLDKDVDDSSKTWMVRHGVWRPTAPNAPVNFVSRQLSSLYANSPETSLGSLAVKFLQAKKSLLGLQGFINGELAEPYEMQDTRGRRIELVSPTGVEVTAEWKKIMTVDCQQSAPHFWHVIRAWSEKQTEGLEAGPLDTWEDIRARQRALNVPDGMVGVDSGFGARSDADVYKNCARFGEFQPRDDALPLHMGWMPTKGMPGTKRWKDPDSGLMLPFYLRGVDPFLGTSEAGQVEMSLLEFSADFFKDILQALRQGKGACRWSVSKAMDNDEYWRHMDGEFKEQEFSSRTGRVTWCWKRRGKYWPNHLLDCENIQIAMATFYGLFAIDQPFVDNSRNSCPQKSFP